MKALVLAAGLGTRLRPLTLSIPKPLCLFFAEPMLDLSYRRLLRAGLNDVAINTHHLSSQIELHIQHNPHVYSPQPRLSHESEILGTGGAINPLRNWIGSDSLLICNSDVISDINLVELMQKHEQSQADASMVLLRVAKPGATPIAIEGEQVIAIGEQPSKPARNCFISSFTGIHIIGPRLMGAISRDGFSSIVDAYIGLLQEGAKIQAIIHDGFWQDLGTPRDYFEAHREVLKAEKRNSLCQRLGLSRLENPTGFSYWDEQKACYFAGKGPYPDHVEDSFIFEKIPSDVSIQSCIVYPNSQLTSHQHYRNKIIGPALEMIID